MTRIVFFGIIIIGAMITGCAGQMTFNETARAGDTVIVAAGYQKAFNRDNITVKITPSDGPDIIINPGDPAIRGVVNLYPDVLASMLISVETNQDITPNAQSYGGIMTSRFTGGDKDFWQTTVFLDLPLTLPAGLTTVEVATLDGSENHSSTLNIIPGTGVPHSFTPISPFGNIPLSEDQIRSMSRVPHHTVEFKKFPGVKKPHSIQITLSHSPDVDNGGVGRTYVVNPRGDLKNITWADDGTTLKVMLFPAKDDKPIRMRDFKFYVAGGVTDLGEEDIEAFDSAGKRINGVVYTVIDSSSM